MSQWVGLKNCQVETILSALGAGHQVAQRGWTPSQTHHPVWLEQDSMPGGQLRVEPGQAPPARLQEGTTCLGQSSPP